MQQFLYGSLTKIKSMDINNKEKLNMITGIICLLK